MDRIEATALPVPGSLDAGPGAPESTPDAEPAKRGRFSGSMIRNVVTTLLVGVAVVALVRVFDSPGGGGTSQTVNITADTSSPPPKVGKPATDFTAQTADGQTVHLSDFAGRPVWITFWASWCPPCRAENSDIQATYAAHQDSGLVVLAVNLGEDSNTVRQYAGRVGLTFPIAIDPPTQIASIYRIVGIPTHFFVDANGVLVEQRIGGMSKKMMEQKVTQLLARSNAAATTR